MKKIFLIYHGRFPAELGIAFFTAKMAEAFCNAGMETIVLVPRRLKRISKTVYEIHNYPKNQKGFYSLLLKRVWKIIATNRWKKEKIMKEFGITEERIIYESNAVDFKSFLPNISTNEARRKLELPEDKFIITYVGM